ncbi:MAG TPA: peptidyl-prolyl cis-trans isomerase [Chthoniobacterales bacterium]
MKRTLLRLALFLIAAALGWGASQLILRTRFGGELVARFVQSEANVRIDKNLRNAAAGERISETEVDHQTELFRDQFGDDQRFNDELGAANLSLRDLRSDVAQHLRERAWIEQQIAPQLRVSEDDVRSYYANNRAQFQQPLRWRAKHLFLAGPDGYADEVILGKLSEIEGLSIRRIDGEAFPALVAEASEDEATKTRGGDLNWFSSARVPPEFIDAIKALRVDEISGPIRSHLGFHLVQVSATQPERGMSLDEARPEIQLALTNQRRALAVAALRERLSTPEFRPN